MDNAAGNRLIVLAAVAVLGAVGGQTFLNQRSAAPTPTPTQPQVIYVPTYPQGREPAELDQAIDHVPFAPPRRIRNRPRPQELRLVAAQDDDLGEPMDDEQPAQPPAAQPPAAQPPAAQPPAAQPPAAQPPATQPPAAQPPAAQPPVPVRLARRIAFVEDQQVLWSGAAVQVRDRQFRVYIRTTASADVAPAVTTGFQISGSLRLRDRRITDDLYGPFEIQYTGSDPSANLTVAIDTEDHSVTLRFPSGNVTAPTQTRVRTNRLADPVSLQPGTVSVFGRYLELLGNATTPTVELLVCRPSGIPELPNLFVPIRTAGDRIAVNSQSQWTARVDLTAVEGSVARVLVRGVDSQLNYQFTDPVAVTLQAATRLSPEMLRITTVEQRDANAQYTARPNLRLNQLALRVKADVPTLATVPGGMAVLVVNGNEIAASRRPLDAGSEFVAEFAAPRVGTYPVAVAVTQGSETVVSTARTVEIQQTGPRPTAISPDNLALTPGVHVVDVQFSHELDPTTLDAAQFTFDNDLRADPPSLQEGNRVRLKLQNAKPGLYKLKVTRSGGTKILADQFGNPLGATADVANQKSEFEFGLVYPTGAEVSSTRGAGLKGMTGPFVAYPEFTAPRPSSAGFNPSDKVVTRVSRLYYYRDAHRVTQILRRDGARSYNRQAVDMQQQLADNARRDAENAVADRQAAERSAIESAQRARAAETALNQFQQALVTARNQQAGASTAVTRQRTVTTQRQREADDAAAEVNRLSDLLAVTPADSPNIDSLRADLAAARVTATRTARLTQDANQELTGAQSTLTQATDQVQNLENQVNALLAEVQTTRNEEARSRELMNEKQTIEDQKQKEAFRREVAAATEDPDTYAPGDPLSTDPVKQVSVSVIGEGLIQLRGPLKGVNLVRTMINEIDAPVGQVKVAIHTVQVNGEHGARMEPVIGRIQRYIDHSRFLTTQSGQMLRNAVTTVASRRAEQVMAGCEAATQAERDQKYIEAFFGLEFLRELHTIDSEFLNTGNKLLSLHSMDSTSLANALFLLALAKNDVREEILQEFEKNVSCKLPTDEIDYFIASNEKPKFGPPLQKSKFVFLGQNAKFVSLRGFFDVEVHGPETLTPLQREFIRLAQIFKSRLVTELEWQQRVMERSLIEDRLQAMQSDATDVATKERIANELLDDARREMLRSQGRIQEALFGFADEVHAKVEEVSRIQNQNWNAHANDDNKVAESDSDVIKMFAEDYSRLEGLARNPSLDAKEQLHRNWTIYGLDNYSSFDYHVEIVGGQIVIKTSESKEWGTGRGTVPAKLVLRNLIADRWNELTNRLAMFERFRHDGLQSRQLQVARELISGVGKTVSDRDWMSRAKEDEFIPYWLILHLQQASDLLDHVGESVDATARSVRESARKLIADLASEQFQIRDIYTRWLAIYSFLENRIVNAELRQTLASRSQAVEDAFSQLFRSQTAEQAARRIADTSRRPLDHKKFLDMLIDDVEDKFIELMEGTRAHTANIDNYLSRLGQALEDDFNTQFYFPAFKGVRETGRYWDVQLGAIESTSVLTNNRTFAKVSPQATMEFDLPKRDILINEAFKSAQAAYDDYGALLGDPTFLALSKLYRGQPPSALFGSGDANPMTRNVLPGLPSSSDEKLVAQARAVAPDFPSALESLIPDPAVYKFETGTGFEVRPVIQPDGQAVVFHLNYMYTTNVREPVRADEKHLGRVKRHFIDTDVQTGNYELREVSRYQVALKASRTSRGVPLLEDVPVAGVLFRPLPSQESSIQENLILAQSVIYPTLFDLMGLRWAPAVADLDALRLQEADFVTRNRQRALRNRVFDFSSQQVDEKMRIDPAERRTDLYRSQESIPKVHPNGYSGPGLNIRDSHLREEYSPEQTYPATQYHPGRNRSGARPYGNSAVEPPYVPSPYGTLRELPTEGLDLPCPEDLPASSTVPPSPTLPSLPVRGGSFGSFPVENPPIGQEAGAYRYVPGRLVHPGTTAPVHLPPGDLAVPVPPAGPPQGRVRSSNPAPGLPASEDMTIPPRPAPALGVPRPEIGEAPAEIGFSPAVPEGPAVRLDRDGVKRAGGFPFGDRTQQPKVELESSSSKRKIGLLPSWPSRPASARSTPAPPAPVRRAR